MAGTPASTRPGPARALVRGIRGAGLLSSEEFRRLHRGGLGDYAYGWVDGTDVFDRRMIWHNGSNTAWYAFVGLIPEADRAIVIVANDGDARATFTSFWTS